MTLPTTLDTARDTASLEVHAVTKDFPGVRALDAVSFSVRAGEVHGLVGENGAGKSTLMAVASGALSPDAGSVAIAGETIHADPDQARDLGLAIVRQEPALMPDLTVAENLYLGVAAAHRPPPGRLEQWATQALKAWSSDVSIDPSDRIASLIPEQRFIVEIAKALAQRPSVLVLDEPTEHLAAEDVDRLFRKIEDLCTAGSSVVYISHRIHEVRRVAHRITVLRDGRDQGTHDARELSEQQIVDLIVGREVDTTFPAKSPPSTDTPDVLTVEGLAGKGYRDVHLRVRSGEIVGLAGIDGNGQREALRGLAGFGHDDGLMQVNGRRVSVRTTAKAVAAGIVYLPGDRHREGAAPELSVRENFSLRILGRLSRAGLLRTREEASQAEQAVRSFNVKTPSVETPIGSLSGGNQQKAVLASALAARPKVLLADEPTQGVDIGARMEIYELLRQVAAQGTAVILLSSDATEVAGLCDRVLVFSRGRVASELTGADVTEAGITTAVLTATTTRDRAKHTPGGIWRWLDRDSSPAVLLAAAAVGLGVFASAVSPFYLTARNFTGLLTLIAVLALVAAGQQLLMLTGGIDLSVGPLMGLTVVIASYYLVDGTAAGLQVWGWVLLFSVPVLVGALNWGLVELAGLHPMVATLATYMSLQAVSLILRPTPGGLVSPAITEAIGTRLGPVPVTVLVVLLIVIGLQVMLYRTRWGLSLRGLGSAPEAARVAGVRPRATRLSAYVACSSLAGLAGILLIQQIGSGDANAGTSYTLQSIAAVVIGGAAIFGGRGSFLGAFMGALLLTQVASVSTFLNLSDAWQFYLLGGLTIVAVTAYSLSRKRMVAT